MSDNIRKKIKSKIAKIAQKQPKFEFLKKITLRLHNGNVFANTTKNPAIPQCIVIEIWTGQNRNFKGVFLSKLQNCWTNLKFNFLLHNFGKYIICQKSFKFLYVKIRKFWISK